MLPFLLSWRIAPCTFSLASFIFSFGKRAGNPSKLRECLKLAFSACYFISAPKDDPYYLPDKVALEMISHYPSILW
jgi:hypothetical protein